MPFYIDYVLAVDLHFALMEYWGETRFGIDDRFLLESSLARPKQTAAYEETDILRQAASLCFGLIKNHPWTGGNKRTATFLMDFFLEKNGFRNTATSPEIYEMSLAVESNSWTVDEIERWLREKVISLEG